MPVITQQDVIDNYRKYAGRDPTPDEIAQHTGQTVDDIDVAARRFFNVQSPGGGGGMESPFDFGGLMELFSGLGPSPDELALIREQVGMLREQRDLLRRQLRMGDIFAQFQAEQSGYEYLRAPSSFDERQKMGAELGLDTIEIPKDFKARQKMGEKYGLPTIAAPAMKDKRQTLADQLGIKVSQLPKAGKPVYQIDATTKIYDLPEAGELVQLRPGELGKMRGDLERELTQQSLKALRGELPVSPTLARSFKDRDALVDESIRRQLGPGGETSSPGIEAKAAERQFQTEATEAARRGELTMAEQFGLGRAGQRLAETGAVAGSQAPFFGVASGFGNVASGFGQSAATSIAGRQASIGGFGAAANIALGGQDLALRSRALDLQRLLALRNLDVQNRQLGIQSDAIQAQRDAAMWNAIANGAGLAIGAGASFF